MILIFFFFVQKLPIMEINVNLIYNYLILHYGNLSLLEIFVEKKFNSSIFTNLGEFKFCSFLMEWVIS